MPYSLVLHPSSAKNLDSKDVGENVYLNNLSAEYKVYVFFYAGSVPQEKLAEKLRELGRVSGGNIFVNIGRLDDPQLDKIVTRFAIHSYPVIVITAISALASAPTAGYSGFARLDGQHLLSSPEHTIECVQTIANLFLQGKFAEAASSGKWSERTQAVKSLAQTLAGPLKAIASFLNERNLNVSLFEGKFELTKT